MKPYLHQKTTKKPRRTRSLLRGPGPILSLLVAELFLCSSILPAWANDADYLRPASVARDGGRRLGELKTSLVTEPSADIMEAAEGGVTKQNMRQFVATLLAAAYLSAPILPAPPTIPVPSDATKATAIEMTLPQLVDPAFESGVRDWVEGQRIRFRSVGSFTFDGLLQSYKESDHPDSRYLAKYGRVWTYDAALGIYSDLKNGKTSGAKKAVDALVALAKEEEQKGFKGLWHFSYNTTGDNYIDPRGPLGANLWAINAIYAYMLQTGDTTQLTWVNEKVKTFIFGQQVMNPKDGRYGLVRAGLYNAEDYAKKDEMGYGVYQGDANVQDENVYIEHNSDAAGTFRFAYHAAKKFGVKDEAFKGELIRRHELVMKGIDKFWAGDHFVTAMNPDGTLNRSVAVDNESWVGAVVLPYDQEKAWKAIQYLRQHFTVTVTKGERRPGETVSIPNATGLFFFQGGFTDPYVPANPKYEQMFQPEATLGVIPLLRAFIQTKAFVETTNDPVRKKEAAEFMALLYQGVVKIHRAYGGRGLPYATVNIHDYFTTMESMAATATASTVNAILKGAPGNDFIYWAPPEEFLVGGKKPSLATEEPVKIKIETPAVAPPQEEPEPAKKVEAAAVSSPAGVGIEVKEFSPSQIALKVNAPPNVLKNSVVLALIETDVWYIQPYAESTFPIESDGTVVIDNFRDNFKKGSTMILVVDKAKWQAARAHLRGDKSYMADWEMEKGPISEAILERSAQDGGRKPFKEVERARTLLEGIRIPAAGRADPMRMP